MALDICLMFVSGYVVLRVGVCYSGKRNFLKSHCFLIPVSFCISY